MGTGTFASIHIREADLNPNRSPSTGAINKKTDQVKRTVQN